MKTAALVLGVVFALITLDASWPRRPAVRRPRETHRLATVRPRSLETPTRQPTQRCCAL